MQKLKSNDYFIKINPKLLFGKEVEWNSKYSPWVYMFLKLWQNYYVQKDLKNTFKVDYASLEKLLDTTRKTLTFAVNDLVDKGLLVRTGTFNKYRLVHEDEVLGNSSKDFIMVFNNFFMGLLEQNLSIRQLKIFYYLIYVTRNFEAADGYIETRETQTSVNNCINSRGKEVKDALDGLERLRLIEKDNKDRLYVREQVYEEGFFDESVRTCTDNIKDEYLITINDVNYYRDSEEQIFSKTVKGEKRILRTKEEYEQELEKHVADFNLTNSETERFKFKRLAKETRGNIEAVVYLDDMLTMEEVN